MTMHSIYFVSYALILTISGIVMAWAYYSRKKNYGVPVNYTLLAVVFGGGMAMWTGVAVTEYIYNPNTVNGIFSMFLVASWIGAAGVWQVKEHTSKTPARRNNITGYNLSLTDSRA